MARPTVPLTDTEIRNAKAKEHDYTLFDGKGLLLLIRSNGSKLWRLRYNHPSTRKRKLIGIGAYPDLSLSAARQKRGDGLRLLAEGKDPHSHWQAEKRHATALHENTFEKVAQEWLHQKRHEVKNKTGDEIFALLRKNIFPTLGHVPISDITATAIIECVKPIEARGALETVRRCCLRVREVLDFAVNRDLVPQNTAMTIHKVFKRPKKRNLPTVTPEELPDVMDAMIRARMSTSVSNCFLWSVLTIARPSEASSLKWSDIDEDGGVVTIPATRMKRARDHLIPITPQMARILETMRPISGQTPYVFCSPINPLKPVNSQSVNAVLKRNGFKGRLVAHGFRSIASTYLHEKTEYEAKMIEYCLSHINESESKLAYFRGHYLEKRRIIMRQWNDYVDAAIAKAMSGKR